MIFQNVWNRFTGDWKSFLMIGLGPFLIGLGTLIVMVILGIATMGPSLFSTIQSAAAFGTEPDPTTILRMIGSFFLFFGLVMVMSLVVGGLIYGGMMGTVVAYRLGEQVSLGLFWENATRYFGRFLGLMFLVGLISMGVSMVSMILMIIPILGWIAVMLIQLTMSVYLSIYAGYLIVADDLGVIDAIGAAFRALFRNIGEAIMAGLVLLGMSFAIGFIALINILPIIGQIIFLGVILIYMPFITYYFVERFETNIRPTM